MITSMCYEWINIQYVNIAVGCDILMTDLEDTSTLGSEAYVRTMSSDLESVLDKGQDEVCLWIDLN